MFLTNFQPASIFLLEFQRCLWSLPQPGKISSLSSGRCRRGGRRGRRGTCRGRSWTRPRSSAAQAPPPRTPASASSSSSNPCRSKPPTNHRRGKRSTEHVRRRERERERQYSMPRVCFPIAPPGRISGAEQTAAGLVRRRRRRREERNETSGGRRPLLGSKGEGSRLFPLLRAGPWPNPYWAHLESSGPLTQFVSFASSLT